MIQSLSQVFLISLSKWDQSLSFLAHFKQAKQSLTFTYNLLFLGGTVGLLCTTFIILPLNMHSTLDWNKVECLKTQIFLLFRDGSSLDCLSLEKANGASCS